MVETMFLGAETIAPLLRRLVPRAEIETRPRLSQLTYAGPAKLTRLPARSAIVAFSANEVYAIAEAVRRRRGGGEGPGEEFVEIDPSELSGVFAAPRWLRDAGLTSWLLVGVTLLLMGLVWLMTLTSSIVLPVITAGVIAAVAGQLVSLMQRHNVPRGLGALLVFLLIAAAGALAVYLILDGIASESATTGRYTKNRQQNRPTD
jgi:hypothetical protein